MSEYIFQVYHQMGEEQLMKKKTKPNKKHTWQSFIPSGKQVNKWQVPLFLNQLLGLIVHASSQQPISSYLTEVYSVFLQIFQLLIFPITFSL